MSIYVYIFFIDTYWQNSIIAEKVGEWMYVGGKMLRKGVAISFSMTSDFLSYHCSGFSAFVETSPKTDTGAKVIWRIKERFINPILQPNLVLFVLMQEGKIIWTDFPKEVPVCSCQSRWGYLNLCMRFVAMN